MSEERGLRQIGQNRWRVSWSYQGRWIRRTVKGTKAQAREVLAAVRGQITEGRYIDRKKEVQTPLTEAVDRFREWSKVNVRKSTQKGDEHYSGLWLEFGRFAGKTLDAITGADVEAYKAWRVTTASKRTADYDLSRLKRMFNLCQSWGLCQHNPVEKVKRFNPESSRERFLSPEEETSLLESAPDTLKPCILFASNTGLRLREMLTLTWGQVDMKRGTVTISAEVAKGKRTRHVPLNDTARAVLKSLPRGIAPDALVFAHYGGRRDGNPKAGIASFRLEWDQIRIDAGFLEKKPKPEPKSTKGEEKAKEKKRKVRGPRKLAEVCWHTLRHTYASRLVLSGVPLPTVQKLLGHQSIAMVMRYAHLSEAHLFEAVRKLDSYPQKSHNEAETASE